MSSTISRDAVEAAYARAISLVRSKRAVSLAELERKLKNIIPTGGDREIVLDGLNIVLWDNASPAFTEVAERILRLPETQIETCSTLIYLIDGRGLQLPVAKRIRAYKRPRWLPICFTIP